MPHFSFLLYNIFNYLRCSDPSLSTSPRCRSESTDFCSSQFLMKRDKPKAKVILGVPETYESQNPPSLWPGQYNVKLAVGQNVSLKFTYRFGSHYTALSHDFPPGVLVEFWSNCMGDMQKVYTYQTGRRLSSPFYHGFQVTKCSGIYAGTLVTFHAKITLEQ